MLANFTDGPLHGTSRDVEIPFTIIEVYWDGQAAPEDIPLFAVVPGATEIWQYLLEASDYDSFADYVGFQVNAPADEVAQSGEWTAAGNSLDVFVDEDELSTSIVVDGDSVYFPDLGITVRLAKRQGE